MKQYSFFQIIYLIYCKIRTVLTFPNARIIRFPIDIRGRKFISIDSGLTSGVGCRIEAYPVDNNKTLFIGKNFQMNDYVHISAVKSVCIGDNVLLASKIYISDCTHGSYIGDENDSDPLLNPADRPLSVKPVIIEDNVWLGEFVSVLPGVTIGKGAIVGANSVVSKNLPPYVIAVGSPAKPIKFYNFENKRWEKYVN